MVQEMDLTYRFNAEGNNTLINYKTLAEFIKNDIGKLTYLTGAETLGPMYRSPVLS